MINILNLGFYSHINIGQRIETEVQLLYVLTQEWTSLVIAEAQTCCVTWEWTSLVLTRQASLPLNTKDVRVDECLYVKKSLNSICSSHKVIVSLQNFFLLNCSIHMDYFYNLFMKFLKRQSVRCVAVNAKEICQNSSKRLRDLLKKRKHRPLPLNFKDLKNPFFTCFYTDCKRCPYLGFAYEW